MVFPVLPGKRQDAETFAKETLEHSGLDDAQRRLGITRENWYLQQSSQGDMVIVFWEAENALKVLEELAAGDSEYERWAKGKIQGICGIDMNEPDPDMSAKMILEWKA